MAADFNIIFTDNLQFEFVDLTDYSTITGETDSELVVKYPPVTGVTGIILDLYNENIPAFGDSFTFVIADQEDLSSLTTGVYEFTLNIKNISGTVVETKTIYRVNPYDIQVCLRRKTDEIMDEQCSDHWFEIGLVGSLLDVAIREALEDRYTASQEIMDYLISKCNEC